ncbi:hypothetical protein ZIOFF_066078 [Zingiber officinale]|uniref:Uncharacterized protein n=1 Tax=Zingiber officinale TaxID=94328 RepID=A0A8J5EY88_ZINOF|nr:hypothetical protein ZIOFF_066078 [Zingiber officinale]
MVVLVMLSAGLLLSLLLPSSMAKNLLYGSDMLHTDESLTNGNNKFIMQSDCNLMFTTMARNLEGKYILVLKHDDHVVIYGIPIWTIPNDETTNRKIAMVTKY